VQAEIKLKDTLQVKNSGKNTRLV